MTTAFLNSQIKAINKLNSVKCGALLIIVNNNQLKHTIMKTIAEVIENLKGGKSAYECRIICESAQKTMNKKDLVQLNEMINYYGGVHNEIEQLDNNFIEVV